MNFAYKMLQSLCIFMFTKNIFFNVSQVKTIVNIKHFKLIYKDCNEFKAFEAFGLREAQQDSFEVLFTIVKRSSF